VIDSVEVIVVLLLNWDIGLANFFFTIVMKLNQKGFVFFI